MKFKMEKDNQQFFIEVYLSLLIYWIHIDSRIFLYDGKSSGYGSCPVYLIHSRVEVLQDKEEKILIVLVELNESQ